MTSILYACTSAVPLCQLSSWSVLFSMPRASRCAHWVIGFEINTEKLGCTNVTSLIYMQNYCTPKNQHSLNRCGGLVIRCSEKFSYGAKFRISNRPSEGHYKAS